MKKENIATKTKDLDILIDNLSNIFFDLFENKKKEKLFNNYYYNSGIDYLEKTIYYLNRYRFDNNL